MAVPKHLLLALLFTRGSEETEFSGAWSPVGRRWVGVWEERPHGEKQYIEDAVGPNQIGVVLI